MKRNLLSQLVLSLITTLLIFVLTENHVFCQSAFNSGRTFPNTRDGIHIFYDQPPFILSDAQIRFLAQNYVGCQKIPLDLVNSIRKYNSNFIVLNYRLAFGTYDTIAGYLFGNDWVNDWPTVSAHDDWFLTDPMSPNPGGRIRQLDWNWFLMDISGEIKGNTTDGWKEYWVRTVLDQLRQTSCDGIFADSFGIPWNLDYTPEWLRPPNDTAWIRHMTIFGDYAHSQLSRQPEGFLLIPNVGPWITTRDICDYGSFSDGVMVEMFASPGPWDLYDIDDWRLEMNRILDIERRGKIVICQPITEDEWAVNERMYNLANYLLIKGEKTYYNLVFGENFFGRLIYFPENKLNLGPYIGNIPENIDELYHSTMNIFMREYQNGVALVNPTWESIVVTLDKPYYIIDNNQLAVNPQIDIRDDGVFLDSLSFRQVSGSITVGYKGGLILLHSITTGANEHNTPPTSSESKITGIYPDPFTSSTTIGYYVPSLHRDPTLTITIYDILGRQIKKFSPETIHPGYNSIIWDGTDDSIQSVSTGVYISILDAVDNKDIASRDIKMMMLIK